MKTYSRAIRWRAHALLAAAAALVIETACSSQAPKARPVDPTQPEPWQTLQRFQGTHEVLRIYTTRKHVVATSNYSLTDSTIVVRQVLKDGIYYENTGNTAIPQVKVPFEIGMNQLVDVERWQDHTTRNNAVAVMAIAGGVAAIYLIWKTVEYILLSGY